MNRLLLTLLLVLVPLLGNAAQYKRISNIDTDVFQVSNGGTLSIKSTATGLTFADLELNGTLTLANDETIDNTTDGTINLLAPVFKQGYDALAYWTATQADGGSVTFNSVSDGTAGFNFSDAVTVTGVFKTGFDAAAYTTFTTADGAGMTIDVVSDGTSSLAINDPVSVSGDLTVTTGNQLIIGTETIAGESTADGLNVKRVARVTYDFAEHGGAVDTIGLGVTIPDNAIITRTYFEQTAAFNCPNGAGTCTVEYGWTGTTNAIVAQAAENNAKYALNAITAGTQDNAIGNFTKLDGSKEIAITIGANPLDAGKAVIFIEYIVSD